MKIIARELYMEQLRPYMGKPIVKVLTGIRRSGKSSILTLLRDELLASGVEANRIVFVNFENMDYADIDDAQKLHAFVRSRVKEGERCCLLFDEIQEVPGWERAINSFLASGDTDVYITGSNARLLSSELATYIAGRYVEIGVRTLSFREYLLFRGHLAGEPERDIRAAFRRFVRLGGFPTVNIAEYEYEAAYKVVNDIYASVILRDAVQRHGIRNIELLDRVVRYVFDNIGHTFSAKNVADYFKSQQRKIDLNTVYSYIKALESAFVVTKVPRYDIKGREILKTMEKYYVADQALIYAAMGYKDRMISGILENIVMHELARRGYTVCVGRQGEAEIDFVGERRDEKIYVQVTYLLGDAQATIEREFAPLVAVRDNYPKYVISMDDLWSSNMDGIRRMHIADFLLADL